MTPEEMTKLRENALLTSLQYRDIDAIKYIKKEGGLFPGINQFLEAIKLKEDDFTFALIDFMVTALNPSMIDSLLDEEFSKAENPLTYRALVRRIHKDFNVPENISNTDIRLRILKEMDASGPDDDFHDIIRMTTEALNIPRK